MRQAAAMLAAGASALLRGLVIALIYLYQGLSSVTPMSCRYEPSCSRYAMAAVARHGALRGGWLAVRRLARCHPWGGCGYDPVPGGDAPAGRRRLAAQRH